MKIDVSAEKSKSVNTGNAKRGIFTLSALVFMLLLSNSSRISFAATPQELQDAIDNLNAGIDRDMNQDVEVINAISVATAQPLSITGGTVAGSRGQSLNFPVYLKSGNKDVASIQFDAIVPANVTVTGVQPGISAQAAGKSVQGNQTAGGFRVLVFGLNQTAIPSGPVAVLQLTSANAAKSEVPIKNVAASDPAGNSVSLSAKNGSLTIR